MRSAVLTKTVTLGILFSIFIALEFKSVFLTSPLVLGFFQLTSTKLFSRSCLPESCCVLENNSLVLGTLALIAFIFATDLSYAGFLTISLSIFLLS